MEKIIKLIDFIKELMSFQNQKMLLNLLVSIAVICLIYGIFLGIIIKTFFQN